MGSYIRKPDGHRVWREYANGEPTTVPLHRLLAVAEFGFDAVCDNEVHHGSEPGNLPAAPLPWANWGANLEVMSKSEHSRHHALKQNEGEDGSPWRDEDVLRGLYWDEMMSQKEIADELGVSRATIKNWLDQHGIQKRTAEERYELRDGNLV